MEKKFLGGRVEKNVFFALCYALNCLGGLGWIIAVVSWIMDKDLVDVEDKREFVSMIIAWAIGTLFILTGLVPLAVIVLCLIAAFKAYKGQTFHIPGAYHLAKLIIK